MKKMNRRGESSGNAVILGLIVGLLVIVIVGIFFFRNNIIELIRNIPGYSVDTRDKEVSVDVPALTGDSLLCNAAAVIATIDGATREIIFKIDGKDVRPGFKIDNKRYQWTANWDNLLYIKYTKGIDSTVAVLSVYKNAKLIKITEYPSDIVAANYLQQLENTFIAYNTPNYICRIKI